MSADGSHDEVRAHANAQRAAKKTLSLTLADIAESCSSIDERCRKLLRDTLDSIEGVPEAEEDGNAADVLLSVAEIWAEAHNIRRNVERGEDETESEES